MSKRRFASLSATRFDGKTTFEWIQQPSRQPVQESPWLETDELEERLHGFTDAHLRIRRAFAGDEFSGL
jgi:hypothetical protein